MIEYEHPLSRKNTLLPFALWRALRAAADSSMVVFGRVIEVVRNRACGKARAAVTEVVVVVNHVDTHR